MRLRRARSTVAAGMLCLLAWGCASPESPTPQAPPPPMRDLSGRWSGSARIGFGLDTPLRMTLVDSSGTLTGTGGEVDCRYFVNCGSFWQYTVTGTHDRETITLHGLAPFDRTWTATGMISADGQLLWGTIVGKEFETSSWSMAPRTSPQ